MVKILLLSAILYSEPAIIPEPSIKIEVNRKRGKGNRSKRRGGGGLR